MQRGGEAACVQFGRARGRGGAAGKAQRPRTRHTLTGVTTPTLPHVHARARALRSEAAASKPWEQLPKAQKGRVTRAPSYACLANRFVLAAPTVAHKEGQGGGGGRAGVSHRRSIDIGTRNHRRSMDARCGGCAGARVTVRARVRVCVRV